MWGIIFILFVFGLLVGSFFNVVTIRYNPETSMLMDLKSIGGRSHCPSCSKQLRWFELFPLFSFLFLRGKCRSCRSKISFQYPIIEFLTGCIFAGVPLFFNTFFHFSNISFFSFTAPWWQYTISGIWIIIFCIFLLMVVVDLKHFIIPNGLNLLLGVLGVFYGIIIYFFRDDIPLFYDSFIRHYAMIFSFSSNIAISHIVGFLIGGMFFVLLVLLTLGRGIGIGDVKLAFALGILLGWPDILLATMLSFIIGGIISGGFVLLGKKHLKEKIPFAPFFIAGVCLVIFFGYEIMHGYFSIFSL